MLKLSPMTQVDFENYLDFAINRYAHEISRNNNINFEAALNQSQNQFKETLPNGLSSPGQFLFSVVKNDTNEKIGMIWYMLKDKNGFKEAFVLDFSINETHRRLGYGKQALLLFEEQVKGQVDALGLHVFKDNPIAYSLYKKLGFHKIVVKESGCQMRKWFNSLHFKREVTIKNQQLLQIIFPEPEDAQKVVDYLNLIGGESDYLLFGKNEFPISFEKEAKVIASMKISSQSLMLIGLIHNEIVSTLTFDRPTRPRLKHQGSFGISVRKDFWNNAVGSNMITSMFEWIKLNAQGLTKINMEVVEENQAAIALYEKFGFRKEGLKTRGSLVNGKYYNNFIMGLEL